MRTVRGDSSGREGPCRLLPLNYKGGVGEVLYNFFFVMLVTVCATRMPQLGGSKYNRNNNNEVFLLH